MSDRRSPLLAALVAAGLIAAGAVAQDDKPASPSQQNELPLPEFNPDLDLEAPGLDLDTLDPRMFDVPGLDPLDGGEEEAAITLDGEPATAEPEPELSREERMDQLFVELAEAESEEDARFIAEEIEALWRDSGSPTVDLLTDRATDALDMGEADLARELINGAIELGPEHAEAWAESARIAMIEEELGIALEHIERAVSLEPRHYYALTELGLILERLDSAAGAYEAFSRALELNPRLPDAVEGAERTRRGAEGREL